MKKLVVLIALVAFLGVMAAPAMAAPTPVAVEAVKGDPKDDKKDDKKEEKKSDKADCSKKSEPCKSTCDDKKEKKDPEKK